MISLKSIFVYLFLNTCLIFISYIQYIILTNYKLFDIFFIILKNLLFVKFVNFLENKLIIKNNYIQQKKSHYLYLLSSSTIEYVTFYIIANNTIFGIHNPNKLNIFYNYLLFIPISLVYEIIFDFFHYWSHRICHINPILYKYIHKDHHKSIDIYPMITFVQNPLDLVLTNTIPSCLTILIIKHIFKININVFILTCIYTYKTYVEICGHSNLKLKRSSSFPQFIWIGRFLNCEIYSEHHVIHHKILTKNYSKRFMLWDKLFFTFCEK
jgi:sterol desaturase/sphingolipid hydroxylase (fatty acid hydroxylase superfamily)